MITSPGSSAKFWAESWSRTNFPGLKGTSEVVRVCGFIRSMTA